MRKLPQQISSDLILPWVITSVMVLMLVVYLLICSILGNQLQQHLPEEQRLVFRTVFYIFAILAFPVTNGIRHIQVRLNETMPGNTPAKKRYLITIIVSMALIESIGILGFIMFCLGDDYNTLYIFLGLSALGFFLYRPKQQEYAGIVSALTAKKSD